MPAALGPLLMLGTRTPLARSAWLVLFAGLGTRWPPAWCGLLRLSLLPFSVTVPTRSRFQRLRLPAGRCWIYLFLVSAWRHQAAAAPSVALSDAVPASSLTATPPVASSPAATSPASRSTAITSPVIAAPAPLLLLRCPCSVSHPVSALSAALSLISSSDLLQHPPILLNRCHGSRRSCGARQAPRAIPPCCP